MNSRRSRSFKKQCGSAVFHGGAGFMTTRWTDGSVHLVHFSPQSPPYMTYGISRQTGRAPKRLLRRPNRIARGFLYSEHGRIGKLQEFALILRISRVASDPERCCYPEIKTLVGKKQI